MRVCGDPCHTLVPEGTRCWKCAAVPNGHGSRLDEPCVPFLMLPAPKGTPPRLGTATTSPRPFLTQSFEEVLSIQVPPLRHIPTMCHPAIAIELTRLGREMAVPIPTWEALHRLMCFPKLVLRSTGRGGR
jgi:hypothetical protein